MGRRKVLSRYIEKRGSGTFKIQITSMVDMFVILLVFLLKSYSTSPIQVNPNKDLTLPSSSSSTDPAADALKLVVSEKGIFVDDKKIVDLQNGQLAAVDSDSKDPLFIRILYNELDEQAKKSKAIAKVNDTVEFDGKIMMQADRELPYELLQKIMYTSSLAGYADLKLAVVSSN
jgi:biopolymer transport protein ExbD